MQMTNQTKLILYNSEAAWPNTALRQLKQAYVEANTFIIYLAYRENKSLLLANTQLEVLRVTQIKLLL